MNVITVTITIEGNKTPSNICWLQNFHSSKYIDSYGASSKGEFDFRSGETQGLIMFHEFHVLNLYKLIITLIPKNNIKIDFNKCNCYFCW